MRVAAAHARACEAQVLCEQEIQGDVDEICDALHAAEGELLAAGRKAWHDWVDRAFDKGGGAAHRFLQDPRDWKPEEIRLGEGVVAGSPLDALTSEAAVWATHWAASEQPPDDISNQEWVKDLECAALAEQPLPPLDVEELRQAGLSFKRQTGVAMDGIHVRHLALLPPLALVVLAILFQVVEQLGCLPCQVQRLLIFLIPKVTGGRRPIMLAPAFYRGWTRARRQHAQEWEDANDQPFFAAGKGRSAVDPVWRRAVEAEVDSATRRSAVSGFGMSPSTSSGWYTLSW
jgi:hypothetical protein